jgi:hypothetical protein
MKSFLLLLSFFGLTLSLFAQTPCEEVNILSVLIDPLNPEQLIITAENNGEELFDYPGFRAYDAEMNLVGEEMVNFFGFVGITQFFMVHTLGDVEPGQEVELTLELWTGFYDELACSWTVDAVMIPEDECAELFLFFMHSNSTDPADPLLYEIYDESDQLVLSGGIQLPAGPAYVEVPVCLPIGCYQATMSTSDAMISSEITMGMGPHYAVESGTAIIATADPGDVVLYLDFAVWTGCLVDDIHINLSPQVLAWPNPTSSVMYIDGLARGTKIQVIDQSGRVVMEESYTNGLNLTPLQSGLYSLVCRTEEGVAVLRVVKE